MNKQATSTRATFETSYMLGFQHALVSHLWQLECLCSAWHVSLLSVMSSARRIWMPLYLDYLAEAKWERQVMKSQVMIIASSPDVGIFDESMSVSWSDYECRMSRKRICVALKFQMKGYLVSRVKGSKRPSVSITKFLSSSCLSLWRWWSDEAKIFSTV